ncbi:hypothetical protein OAA06_02220 [bacterium]|nr:hypothetical protein [bacterium]
MSIETYREKTRILIDETSIRTEDIFEYDLSEHSDEFDEIITFYQQTLDLNQSYGITPATIFLNPSFSLNAKASKQNNHYMISLNMGTVVGLIQRFRDNTSLIDSDALSDYKDFENSLDTPISMLMYQNALNYTFYHEMAHLIQGSELLQKTLNEQPTAEGGYSELKHLLELDADEFSAISISTLVYQYSHQMFGDNMTIIQFEKVFVIAITAVFLYLKSFPSDRRDIYYEESSHPHPIIRITALITAVVSHCSALLAEKGFSFVIDKKKLIYKTIELSELMAPSIFTNYQPWRYTDILRSETDNILAYLRKFEELKTLDDSLATKKWNTNIEK